MTSQKYDTLFIHFLLPSLHSLPGVIQFAMKTKWCHTCEWYQAMLVAGHTNTAELCALVRSLVHFPSFYSEERVENKTREMPQMSSFAWGN